MNEKRRPYNENDTQMAPLVVLQGKTLNDFVKHFISEIVHLLTHKLP